MVDSLLGFLMVITLVSSKLSQALQIKKKSILTLISEHGRMWETLSHATSRNAARYTNNEKKAAVLERSYNTILKC